MRAHTHTTWLIRNLPDSLSVKRRYSIPDSLGSDLLHGHVMWEGYFTPLCLSSAICKLEVVTELTQGFVNKAHCNIVSQEPF